LFRGIISQSTLVPPHWLISCHSRIGRKKSCLSAFIFAKLFPLSIREGDVMHAQMMSALGGSLRTFVRPVQKMNQMAIAHAEKVMAIYLESIKAQVNLGMSQWKARAEVNDPSSFMSYLAKQGGYMTKVSEQVVSDIQKISGLTGEFMEKAQSVAHEEARAIGGAVGETGKASAKKAV
jgi:phasin family protein